MNRLSTGLAASILHKLSQLMLLVLLAPLAHIAQVQAADFRCIVPGDERHLRLDIPGQEHLCEVSVTHESGERKVLWYANNDTLFCSAKADELVNKYVSQWGFDCDAWPVDDDLLSLNEAQRRRLDEDLRKRHAASDSRPAAVRVVTGPPDAEGKSLIAVQWIYEESTADSLSVFRDDNAATQREVAQWQTLAEINDLTSVIGDVDTTVQRALIDQIDTTGALTVETIVQNPGESAEDTPACRGEQHFSVDDNGGLAPLTPHRYSCDEDNTRP